MKKTLILNVALVTLLLAVVVYVLILNQQLQLNNSELNEKVNLLNNKINQLTVVNRHTEQRLAQIEEKLTPKFQEMLSMN